MTNSRLFLRHFKAGLSLAFIFCGLLAFGQYPAAPNKIGLGRQTTGDGLVFRTSGKPAYTPTTAFNAWMALDTTTGNLWTYRAGEWFLEVAGDLRLVYPVVINKSGVDIKQGQVVMVDTVQLVQGDQVRVRPAIATVSNSQLIMGVASTDINNNATGYISWFGYVREVDHADIAQTGVTLDVGDILYISATEAGKYTDTEPAAPNVNSTIALVVRKPNANNMTLLVRPWLNEKLGDLRDVDLAGLQTGDGIKWNGTKWVAGTFAGADSTVVSAGYGIDVSEVSNNFTVSADTSELSTKWYAADTASGVRDWVVAQGYTSNTGTVTSIATNNGVTGGTITTTGTIGLTGQALALHNLSTNGLIARTGAGTVAGRTITAGTGISVTNGDGVSGNPTITNSAPDQTVVLTAGTGISTSGTYPNFTITNSAPDQTVSIAAGTGISTSGSYPNFTITNSAPDQTVSITGAGINAVTGTYPNFTITGTEVDGSTTNELQNLSLSGQSLGITSGTGVTLPIIDVSAGSGISVSKASGNATVSATDASVSNEGTLGVGAGGANTAVITSNTSGANGVTIAGGSNIAITESNSSNGGTVTIAATGLASSYIVQTRGETPSFSSDNPAQNSIVNFTDTLNFAFFGLYAADVYTEVSANKISIVGEFSNLYNNNGSLTSPRTISTAGHKLTISGSNTAQVLEIDNTNTGTTTNALTLQSFGPPLQATRLTSSTGSILPVSDYFVNTSSTAAVGLGGFQRFYIEDAGGLNKEAGRIGFRTSDATGSSYDSEAFISVRKDSSELKEGLTLLSTGQLQFKEYGDTLFTGTAVKYLAVADDGKVIEVDGAAGTVKGTGAANKVAIWASADSLYQNTNLHWDEANERLRLGDLVNPVFTPTLMVGTDVNFPGGLEFHTISSGTSADARVMVVDSIRHVFAFAVPGHNNNLQLFGLPRKDNVYIFNSGGITRDMTIGTLGNNDLHFGTNNNVRVKIDSIGRMGIGTTTPANTLDVEGGAAIGASYSGTSTAPTNGLLVEGETYIGKTTDGGAYKLQVSGAILTDSITISHSAQTAKISNFYPSGANGNNLFIGNNGGAALNSTSLNSSRNLGIGLNTLNKATSGYDNVVIGANAGQEITTSNSATVVGVDALKAAQTANNLTAIGTSALRDNTTGSQNTGVGAAALVTNTTGSNNTAVGFYALPLFAGSNNTALGYHAGRFSNSGGNMATNSNSIFIGYDSRSNTTSASNEIVIGYEGRGNGSNTTTIGNTSTTRTHILGTLVASKGAPVTRTTSTYDMTNTPAVNYVIANFAGTMTITLPTASSWTGRELTIKTVTANTVISNANNVVPIDDTVAGNAILPATDGAWALLVSDGTNWIIMQKG